MPVREILGKSVAFLLIGAVCIGGGAMVFYGPHAYNDYFNAVLAIVLILAGLGVWGFGALTVLAIVAEARRSAHGHSVHVTPRPGPLGPPPPWGMGDIGRPGATGVREVGSAAPQGGGAPRLMSVRVSSIDAPIMVGVLLVWTVAMLILLAPR